MKIAIFGSNRYVVSPEEEFYLVIAWRQEKIANTQKYRTGGNKDKNWNKTKEINLLLSKQDFFAMSLKGATRYIC